MLVKQAYELSPPEGVTFNQACELSSPKDRINALRCSLNVSRELSTDWDIVLLVKLERVVGLRL